MDLNNEFPLQIIIQESDESLTLVQSNEMLGSVIMECSKPARLLLNFIYYYVSTETPNIIQQMGGFDKWNSPKNRMVEYNIDLTPLYSNTYIKEHYAQTGKKALHETFKAAAKEIIGKPLTLVNDLGQETAISAIISNADIDPETGELCSVLVNREVVSMLVPELIKLRDISETHRLSIIQTFGFASKYSEKIYTYLNGRIQANDYQGKFVGSIQMIKKMLRVVDGTYYADNRKFVQKILKKSIDEINETSDLTVSYDLIKDGRYYKWIEFCVSRKGDTVVYETDVSGESVGIDFINIPEPNRKEEIPSDDGGLKENNSISKNDSMLFYEEAEKDGFTATQVLNLYNHFNGNVSGLYTARAAYQAVSKMGIVEAENKYDFYMTVSCQA